MAPTFRLSIETKNTNGSLAGRAGQLKCK
jgi:hypothetical protein